jgi:hypothetical protein
MNSNTEDLYFLFRKTGSEGIVIFERDEVLLKGVTIASSPEFTANVSRTPQ